MNAILHDAANAAANDAVHDEMLTLAEMEARYPDQWLLIDAPEFDEDLEIIRGRVIAHNADRSVVFAYDMQHRPQSAAYLFTGEMPEMLALNL